MWHHCNNSASCHQPYFACEESEDQSWGRDVPNIMQPMRIRIKMILLITQIHYHMVVDQEMAVTLETESNSVSHFTNEVTDVYKRGMPWYSQAIDLDLGRTSRDYLVWPSHFQEGETCKQSQVQGIINLDLVQNPSFTDEKTEVQEGKCVPQDFIGRQQRQEDPSFNSILQEEVLRGQAEI